MGKILDRMKNHDGSRAFFERNKELIRKQIPREMFLKLFPDEEERNEENSKSEDEPKKDCE